MGFDSEEVKALQKLCDLEMEGLKEDDSLVSLPSSSEEYLSSDGLYLKHLLSKPLAQALREIIAKKPFDPIEYLGHWLLNYKVKYHRYSYSSFYKHNAVRYPSGHFASS